MWIIRYQIYVYKIKCICIIYVTCYSLPSHSLFLSLPRNFILDIVFNRQSVSTFIVPLLILVLLFCHKKTRAWSSRSYDCSSAILISSPWFLMIHLRLDQEKSRRSDRVFSSFTIALFKFLRLLPYNRIPEPRLFCANDEDAECTAAVLPKRHPSPVRFVTRYFNTTVFVLK